jgi:hypothetical protein
MAVKTEQNIEELVTRTRELNEQIITAGKQAGETYLKTYERALTSIADMQEEVGKSSPYEWVTAVANAPPRFPRDLAVAYPAAGRELVK